MHTEYKDNLLCMSAVKETAAKRGKSPVNIEKDGDLNFFYIANC